MTKSQAIRLKCLECSGDSHKEVTLCHIVDCHPWPFRFGYSMRDKRFKKRILSAKKNYPAEFKEMRRLVLDYSKELPNSVERMQIINLFK